MRDRCSATRAMINLYASSQTYKPDLHVACPDNENSVQRVLESNTCGRHVGQLPLKNHVSCFDWFAKVLRTFTFVSRSGIFFNGKGTSFSAMSVDWIGYGYAALVASGGIAGYVKAGSVPSLAAGLLCGGLAGLGAYQQSKDPNNIWLSLAASGTLTVLMGMRFYNSRKLMPAGLIAGASLLMVGKLGLQMMEKPL
ncbi:transmembrane protein 14C isoform X1 [Python bivittatus]|uniref:Transmembrane protein 14C n=2 Tax=Python bivittatus TaxID=176946 RepID=A0A9F2WCR4_PYTBI|nr:transmembrane protein 14C isoform X1 [Python bivittatus]